MTISIMLKLMTSASSGWRIFKICVIQVWIVVRYICLWPGVSDMILTLFQCDSDMAQNCDFGAGQSCDFCVFRFCCVVWIYVLTKYQNHIKTMSKTISQTMISNTISKSYHHIKIKKNTKSLKKWTKSSGQLTRNPRKVATFLNHIKDIKATTISKSYQYHIQNKIKLISKTIKS